jgi:glycosyltransferase involved in cell wall biosynthesis
LIRLSLVIPCFNEGKNLPLLLERCSRIGGREGIEIVIVDNGSTDNSQTILNELLPNYPFVTLVHVKQNEGYGYGILEGLKSASGDILSWTHADMQADPCDAIEALKFFQNTSTPEKIFVKGRRYGRHFADVFFTMGMSFFETLLLRTPMWDINAQPNMFHRSFYNSWIEPPTDFSLDLYVYFMAKKRGLDFKRFPVFFGERAHGVSSWNVSPAAKYRFIKRTLAYSFALIKKVSGNA